MLGIVFYNDQHIFAIITKLFSHEHKRTYDKVITASILNELFVSYNILVHFSGSDPNVLQITPPLIINRNQINYFIKSMDELLSNGVMSIAAKFISKNVL